MPTVDQQLRELCVGCDIVPREYHTWCDPRSGVSLCQSCSELYRGDGTLEANERVRAAVSRASAESHR